MSSTPLTSTSTAPTREATRTTAPSARGRASARSSGCISRWCRGRPRVSRLGVVQPGVAVLLVPAPDQQQLAVAPASTSPRRRRDPVEVGRRPARAPGRSACPSVCSRSGIVGRSGPRSTPSGCLRSARIVVRPPVLSRPVMTVAGLGASRALVASRSLSPAPSRAWSRSVRSRKISQSCRASSGLAKTAGREPRRVADREAVEDQVVLVALQRGRRRQDHVGVPGGLVEVDVDRDHEVQRRRAPGPARRRPGVDSTGLPAMVTIARIWPSPGVSISSRITAAGSSPPNSGMSRTRLRHTSWWPGPTIRRADRVDRPAPGTARRPRGRSCRSAG